MLDISGQLIKDSYSYILQADTSTGYVYRVNGNVPVNPIFSSGLTVFSAFTFVDGNQSNGYVLTSDANGNSRWASVSGASVSSVTASTGLSGNSTTGAITLINTAPDQTVTISGGTGITTGGTYPNFSIVNTAPDKTVTITGGTNIEITGAYPDFGVNFTGTTSGEYLPLSGGTVTGDTIFQSGLTANTITITGLTSATDSNVVTIDNEGILHTYPISGLTGTDGSNTRRFMWDGTGDTVVSAGTFVNGASDNLQFTDNYLHFSYDYDYYGNSVSTWFDIASTWTSVEGGDKIILQLTKVGDNSIIGQYFGVSYITPTGSDVVVKLNGLIVATNYTLQVGELYSFSWVLNGADGSGTVNSVTASTGLSGDTTTGDITLINTAPDQTVVITGGTNIQIVSDYPNFGVNFTGTTSSGDYLPLSGGTVTGGTIFQSGVTANTISEVNYVNFKTSPSVPNPTGGTLYYNSTENVLSYKPITNQNDVTVNLGQESLIRIYNNLGYQINNGQVLHITGATTGVPTVALANASKLGTSFIESLAQSSGVATHDIPSGQYGFMTSFGIVRDLNTTAFTVGQEVFLSDTVDGALTNSPNNIAFTSRVSTVGYCLESNATTGKILVSITNENLLQSLTQLEVNVLLGNTISTGVYEYTGMTQGTGQTINVAYARGWIVYNTNSYATNPLVINVYYTGGTNIPLTYLSSADATYFLINSGATLLQQATFPTPQERRENLYLGKVVHPNRSTILAFNNTVDFDVSPMSAIRDIWTPIKLINQGVLPSFNTGLTINTSYGTLWGNGIGWTTSQLNPDSVTITAKTRASFFYRTQTGGTSSAVFNIDPTKYDVGGVITSVGTAGSNDATNQRIYMYPTGVINILYGQTRYTTLAAAVAAIDSESFVIYPNADTTGILIGVISVRNDIVDDVEPLTNTAYAKLTLTSKFGESFGGTGGISTTTLQQAYNNSTSPEIVISAALDGLSIKNGTGNADNVTNLLEGIPTSTTGATSFIRADGLISGSSVSAPTISATTYYGLPSSSFSGGTVNGETDFTNGLSANTMMVGSGSISASAVLESSSTTQGFLPPRMTEAQRIGISSPATGLMVYQTDGDEGLYINKSFGWVQII